MSIVLFFYSYCLKLKWKVYISQFAKRKLFKLSFLAFFLFYLKKWLIIVLDLCVLLFLQRVYNSAKSFNKIRQPPALKSTKWFTSCSRRISRERAHSQRYTCIFWLDTRGFWQGKEHIQGCKNFHTKLIGTKYHA